ncbi:MAG: SDR family oxidoreductase [Leptolyngbyaceae cyanobacterium]
MTVAFDRYALITGASSGIGKATALAFARAGIHLVLVSRNQVRLQEVASLVSDFDVNVKIHCLDLAQVDQVQGSIAAIVAGFGPVSILVNCAGMGYTGRLAQTSLTDWQQVLNLNLTSVFQCIQGVLPTMRQHQQGTIINVTSVAGSQVFPEWGAYCVSKFGLTALSKTLAVEERANGIRVVMIAPGAVNTGIWDTDSVQADFDRALMLTPEMVADSILHAALLPAQAVIEELKIMPNVGTF